MITLQIIAAITTIMSVVLMSKEKVSSWVWGIIGLISYFFIYLEQKLYLQAGLQIAFLGLAIFGIINWTRKKNLKPNTNISDTIKYFGVVLVGSWIISMIYGSFTDASSPFIDTWTTALAILGSFWLAKKRTEGWIIWSLTNLILFILFFSNKLYISSLVELLLFVISLSNIFQWENKKNKKSLR